MRGLRGLRGLKRGCHKEREEKKYEFQTSQIEKDSQVEKKLEEKKGRKNGKKNSKRQRISGPRDGMVEEATTISDGRPPLPRT